MTLSTNYYNRSIDLSIFQGIKSSGAVTVEQSLFNSGGEVCTGIQKLIQRWLIAFLTPKGTMKYHPEWGTDFLVNVGSLTNEVDAEIEFYMCNSDACDQLKSEDENDGTVKEDEQLESVKLNGIVVSSTGFSLNIKLTSLAGESAPLILPITVNPLQL